MCNVGYRSGVLTMGLLILTVASQFGCSLDLLSQTPVAPNDNGEADDGETSLEGLVLVRFVNRATEEAVDVQFYATNEPLGMLPDDLFVEGNRVTRSIGLAGRGIIEPGMADAITFPCTDDLTLGTMGGAFAEAETGDERGTGNARWAQETPLGLCGSVVTFEYRKEGEEFTTLLRLDDST